MLNYCNLDLHKSHILFYYFDCRLVSQYTNWSIDLFRIVYSYNMFYNFININWISNRIILT